MTFEQLILQQRPHVDRVIQDLARRHYLASAEVSEFRGAVERAIEHNDYELLRAFDGRSTWETYLTTVITRQYYLFQQVLWGQWRPTAAAQRLGAAAVLLEELVVRDRFAVADAIDWMRTAHRVDLPRHRLMQLAEELEIAGKPPVKRWFSAAARPAPPAVELTAALNDALALVSADDRLILELRFRDRQPLTRIAAMLKIDVRPVQRRIETAKEVIRQSLITQGLAAGDVEALLSSADAERENGHQKWWDTVLARPSKGAHGQ